MILKSPLTLHLVIVRGGRIGRNRGLRVVMTSLHIMAESILQQDTMATLHIPEEKGHQTVVAELHTRQKKECHTNTIDKEISSQSRLIKRLTTTAAMISVGSKEEGGEEHLTTKMRPLHRWAGGKDRNRTRLCHVKWRLFRSLTAV